MAKPLNIALGLDIDGKPVFANIAKMPHGLIAGKTGSGKSVCVNSLLVSLLLKNTPNDLKLILVDPKKVEMTAYSDLPHLLTPVITDPKLANEALKWACDEMDRRYNIFSSYRVRDIITYNEKIKNEKGMQKMPYIVIFIDELSDLMLTCGGDVENSIKRITQLGRASGIHAIVATQRPTIDVIKGTIKANIPTRIAFSVKSYTDSTTVLDQSGAETLLGHGDMLFQDGILMRRLQGPYLTDNEIANVTDYIRDNYGPDYKFTHEDLQEKTKQEYGASDEEDMELVFAVAMEFAECQMCSINSMQKKFSLGFNRGQKIVEILEKMGVVSPKKGTQGRDVLMDTEQVKEVFHRK